MTLDPGSTFGPYEIVEALGQGGMATVYKAWEADLERHVALKVLPVEFLRDPSFGERFQREARVVAKLEHPNIVPIFAYGIEEQQRIPWMAMRLIDGGHVGDRIGDTRLNVTETIALIAQVADALDYAHGLGVIHRDIKPQNILLDKRGRVYLADFGIARLAESSGVLTRTGVITGTPQYMAPEQATGEPVDHRSDVYSLGIVAYKLLTGRAPFDAPTPVALLMKHANEAVPLPPADVVPQALAKPLLKALEKRPRNRWQSAGEFAHALGSGLAQLTSPPERRPGLVRAPGDPTTRSLSITLSRVARKPAFWAASALALTGFGGLTVLAALAIWIGSNLRESPWPPLPEATPVPTPAAIAAPEDAALAAGALEAPEPEQPGTPAPPTREATPAPRQTRQADAVAGAGTPVPTPLHRVSLTLSVDAAQDPRNPDAVAGLRLLLRVGGEEQPPLQLDFGTGSAFARSRTRADAELLEVVGGAQNVTAVVSADPAGGRPAAEATAQLVLREGGRIPVEVRERLDGSWEVRFR